MDFDPVESDLIRDQTQDLNSTKSNLTQGQTKISI